MIILYHKQGVIRQVESKAFIESIDFKKWVGKKLVVGLLEIGDLYPEARLVWCRLELKEYLHLDLIPQILRHPLEMVSYRLEGDPFDFDLDYIDYSTAVKVQKGVRYPTWKMSSTVGVAFGSLFKGLQIISSDQVDYFLNAIARNLQPDGLLCYQDPRLLKPNPPKIEEPLLGPQEVFRFIWGEVADKWAFFLFVSKVKFENKWAISAFLKAYSKRKSTS